MTEQMKQSLKDRVGYIADACKLGIGGDIAEELEAIVNWYRNNVWHDGSEKPEEMTDVLGVTTNKEMPIRIVHTLEGKWLNSCGRFMQLEVKKWAYIEDLMPDKI